MPGRQYGVVIFARTPPTYAGLPGAEKAKPGKALESDAQEVRRQGRDRTAVLDIAFTHEALDVIVAEGDDPLTIHAFQEDLDRAFARFGGDPTRFGTTVHRSFGINPDADQPKRGKR